MYTWLSPEVKADELIRQFDGQMRLVEATKGACGISFVLTYVKSVQDVVDGFSHHHMSPARCHGVHANRLQGTTQSSAGSCRSGTCSVQSVWNNFHRTEGV